MAPKIAVTRKLHIRTGKDVVMLPFETVKAILADVGFAGKLLFQAADSVYHEATRVARAGVISGTDFEKAVVRGIGRTNDIAMNSTKKLVRKVLK